MPPAILESQILVVKPHPLEEPDVVQFIHKIQSTLSTTEIHEFVEGLFMVLSYIPASVYQILQ